jgi:hypothetical protein
VRRLAPDGVEAWKQVVERGYEGYVAKDEATRWLKVKQKGLLATSVRRALISQMPSACGRLRPWPAETRRIVA